MSHKSRTVYIQFKINKPTSKHRSKSVTLVLQPIERNKCFFVYFFLSFAKVVKGMELCASIACGTQSHYRVVKWNFNFFNFALLRQVRNTKYEPDVILYSQNKFQPDPCTKQKPYIHST